MKEEQDNKEQQAPPQEEDSWGDVAKGALGGFVMMIASSLTTIKDMIFGFDVPSGNGKEEDKDAEAKPSATPEEAKDKGPHNYREALEEWVDLTQHERSQQGLPPLNREQLLEQVSAQDQDLRETPAWKATFGKLEADSPEHGDVKPSATPARSGGSTGVSL